MISRCLLQCICLKCDCLSGAVAFLEITYVEHETGRFCVGVSQFQPFFHTRLDRLVNKLSHASRFVPVAHSPPARSNGKDTAIKIWYLWPEWREWPDKFSKEKILHQGKVPIQLSEMQKICFTNKWRSVTKKTIILFKL